MLAEVLKKQDSGDSDCRFTIKRPVIILLKGNKCVTQTFKNEVTNQTYCTLNI